MKNNGNTNIRNKKQNIQNIILQNGETKKRKKKETKKIEIESSE